MAWVLAVATFIVSLAALAPVLFIVALVLAGPHSDVLPGMVQPAVLGAAWIALLVVPLVLARRVFVWHARRAG